LDGTPEIKEKGSGQRLDSMWLAGSKRKIHARNSLHDGVAGAEVQANASNMSITVFHEAVYIFYYNIILNTMVSRLLDFLQNFRLITVSLLPWMPAIENPSARMFAFSPNRYDTAKVCCLPEHRGLYILKMERASDHA
jgi:hypothetical protein